MCRAVHVLRDADNGALVLGLATDLETLEAVERDADLREKRLLDVDAHPVMAFRCDDVRAEGAGWRAEGTLALRGTSCPLSITGAVDGSEPGAVHVRGTAVLDRTAIGIRTPRLVIGREVTITVDAWLTAFR